MKRGLMLAVAALATVSVLAQTNLQVQYGVSEKEFIGTVEHFSADSWGNTFFFVDITKSCIYGEIARSFNFWQNSKAADLSVQLEYDWQDAILIGPNYCFHNAEYNNTCTFQILYKRFLGNSRDRSVPVQVTCVWTLANIFNIAKLQVSGYLDIWYENSVIVLSEPQIWYNAFGGLNIGGEVQISQNFMSPGFKCYPRFGAKWVF